MKVAIDEAVLNVRVMGSGRCIVLLHGFPLSGELWSPVAEDLQREFTVLVPDLRGMGASNVPGGPYLMETLAGDLVGLLDAYGIGEAVIAGHSLGSYVALTFYRMFVERTAGIALVSGRVDADSAEMAARRIELADRTEREGMQPIVDWYVPKFFAPAMYEARPDAVALAAEVAARTNPAGAAAMLRGMAQRVSNLDLVADFERPLLVVAGTEDTFSPLKEVESVARRFPDSRLSVLEGCGHMPMLERPAELSAALAQFAADCFAGRDRA